MITSDIINILKKVSFSHLEEGLTGFSYKWVIKNESKKPRYYAVFGQSMFVSKCTKLYRDALRFAVQLGII